MMGGESETISMDSETQAAPAAPAELGAVHHFWIFSGTTRMDATASGKLMPFCLLSHQPLPQILWTYEASRCESQVVGVQGILIKNPESLMPRCQVEFMLENNVPPQFIKDIMSMKLLHRFGGVFTDSDVMGMGAPMSRLAPGGFCLIKEPPFPRRRYEPVCLAHIGLPKGSPEAWRAGQEMEHQWMQWAAEVRTQLRRPLDWQQPHPQEWMSNTKRVTSIILESPCSNLVRDSGSLLSPPLPPCHPPSLVVLLAHPLRPFHSTHAQWKQTNKERITKYYIDPLALCQHGSGRPGRPAAAGDLRRGIHVRPIATALEHRHCGC